MTYTSLDFFILFVSTFAGYLLLRCKTWRFAILLTASLLFYLWSGFFDFVVFLFVVVICYASVWLAEKQPAHRKPWLTLGIVILALHLFAWKYLAWAATLIGWRLNLPLPVGISFFTLQGIAYMVDYFRREAEFMSVSEFLLFKSFFAQLVAGPIVRAREVLPYFRKLPTPSVWQTLEGAFLIALGLFKKLVVADYLALLVNTVFSNPTHFDRVTLISSALAFYMQIWADFSGYTDIGRGCALMVGLRLPQNFYSPFYSLNPGEWMSRWHVTLGRWMRSYIYLPLSKSLGQAASRSRFGRGWRGLRHLVALTITLLAIGLWHGASSNFFIYGLGLCFLFYSEFFFRRFGNPIQLLPKRWRPIFAWLIFFPMTVLMAVFFRCPNGSVIYAYFSTLFAPGSTTVSLAAFTTRMVPYQVAILALEAIMYFDLRTRTFPLLERLQAFSEPLWRDHPRFSQIATGLIIVILFVSALHFRVGPTLDGFIYFKF